MGTDDDLEIVPLKAYHAQIVCLTLSCFLVSHGWFLPLEHEWLLFDNHILYIFWANSLPKVSHPTWEKLQGKVGTTDIYIGTVRVR